MKSLQAQGQGPYQRLIFHALHYLETSFRSLWFVSTMLACVMYAGISAAAENLQSLPVSNPVSAASCLVPEAGAPSCGIQDAPGSTSITPSVPYHVGNPIDVVSGN